MRRQATRANEAAQIEAEEVIEGEAGIEVAEVTAGAGGVGMVVVVAALAKVVETRVEDEEPPRQPAAPAAYVNPAFGAPAQAQSQMDPQAFAQAMSFMSTPAGLQSMAAFATHMSGSPPQHQQPMHTQPPQHSPSQHAGQKRKRPEHSTNVPPLPPKKAQSGPKPPRAKAAAPPPVPSFGFSLPAPVAPASRPSNTRESKKRVNLGLGAQNAIDDSSSEEEEEDVDEEAAFAEKVKVEGVAFEHNGEMISLQTAADVQAYIKDRRRNYPTQQRIAEKAQADAARREHELEFLYRVKGKARRPKPEPKSARPPKPERKVREVDARKQEELAALRKRLHESMVGKQQAPSNLLGVGYDSETESDGGSSVLSESSVVSSEESDSDSDEEVEEEKEAAAKAENDSDSDAPPVATSSKAAPPPIAVPPPAPSSTPASQICRNWTQHGRCKHGARCRWVHPAESQGVHRGPEGEKGKGKEKGRGREAAREKKKMGLYEKLVEQELEKSDGLALAAIRFLGQNGFLG